MIDVPVNHQIIKKDGLPTFVIIPYIEYLAHFSQSGDDVKFPQAVVEMHCNGMLLIQAWRKYLKLTQKEVAFRLNMTQSGYAQIEKAKPHRATLVKVAKALDLQVEQLMD